MHVGIERRVTYYVTQLESTKMHRVKPLIVAEPLVYRKDGEHINTGASNGSYSDSSQLLPIQSKKRSGWIESFRVYRRACSKLLLLNRFKASETFWRFR